MRGTICLLTFLLLCSAAPGQDNPVRNGNFEQADEAGLAPAAWTVSGAAHVKQLLSRDTGREGKGFAAKLVCTEFQNGTPSSHAMVCQVGVVSVQRGKWYRLSFWAKGEDIKGRILWAALMNTQPWQNAGLYEGAVLWPRWQRYEMIFQATEELAAERSRLQFWFSSTGTLWLDDVEFAQVDMKAQRQPQLPAEGRVNLVPNSSFECGAAGWGSYSPDLRTWQGNVYELIGDLDATTAAHGRHSLRIHLSASSSPTFFFDYFDPVRQPVRCLVAAHHGWAALQRGRSYTLSASMKADKAGAVGVLFVRPSNLRSLRKDFPLTADWQRYVFTFTTDADSAWTGVGLDLAASNLDAATVWVDAVQLEAGAEATPYQPALPLEVMMTSAKKGHLFVPEKGRPEMAVDVLAFNNTGAPQAANATIAVTDFWDAEVLRQAVSLDVPAQAGVSKAVSLPVGKLGFYRVQLPPHPPLRLAVIAPFQADDSRFGMNHAYPWAFLLQQAHRAGVLWWRDWTIQWRTVQPQPDAAFDFRETDAQIDRVLNEGGKVLALFPFPSSDWTSTIQPGDAEKITRKEYERRRVPLAFKPKDEPAFTKYIAQSVRHYRNRLRVYQVFNESLYTSYALPARAGHTMDDYLRLLRLASAAVKAEQPDAAVLAGPGIWADSKWTKDFVEAGGLKLCDALDVHLYPKGEPEAYGESLASLWRRMVERDEAKPIWLTELGCYADDDPPITPLNVFFGDEAMRRALHPSEREATEWLVKFSTLFFANGGAKIFLHAGTCGEINGMDVGGIFFEYGAAPRKMLIAVAVMARLLPPDAKFERTEAPAQGVVAHWFGVSGKQVAVVWSTDGQARKISLPQGTQALDLMGNPIAPDAVTASQTPIYLRGE